MKVIRHPGRVAGVTIEIFDVQGRRIATPLDGEREAGRHTLHWKGQTGAGARAAAGVYLCRMSAGTLRAESRVSMLP